MISLVKRYSVFIQIFIFTLVFVWISKVTLTRVGAFGCFDDCFNYIAAHFMLQGKHLFSEIFFNHQPFAAYVSLAIQYVTQPQTLYQLVLYHRVFIMAMAYCLGVFFILRFRTFGFAFGLLSESTKFFIFGNRFLAESIIIYPIVYMFFLLFKTPYGMRRMSLFEYYLSPILCYLVIFFREPFIPLAVVLYVALLFQEKEWKKRCTSVMIFCVCIVPTLLFLPFSDYVFNVFYVNYTIEIGQQSFSFLEIMKMIWYPMFVLFTKPTNVFSIILWILSISWCALLLMNLLKKKKILSIILMLILLGVSNIRVVPVGSIFFEAFHEIVWYGLFICSILIFIEWLENSSKKKIFHVSIIVCILLGFFSLLPYKFDTMQSEEEFNNGYANYYSNGEVIRILSNPTNTVFVEMWDDPIYWVTRLPSSYQYSWYTSIMPFFPKYVHSREYMWENTPPDFYYGNCGPNMKGSMLLSEKYEQKYMRLLFSGKPSCIYIKKDVAEEISVQKWEILGKMNYSK